MILDGEGDLGEEQLEEFWGTLQSLRPLPIETPLSLADARCSGATVLLLRHLGWLNGHPDRLEWCTRTLIDTLSNPPPVSQFDSDVSVSQEGWAHFCARIIPALWAEHPDAQELRQSIVTLCLEFHYVTARLLSATVFSVRARLGDDYFRFRHLVRVWAVERWRLKEARRLSYYDGRPLEDTMVQLSVSFAEVAQAFLDGTLSPTLPPLPAPVRVQSAQDRTGSRRKAQRAFPRVDTMLLTYSATGLPALASLDDFNDRQEVVRVWNEVLDLMVAELVDESVEDCDPADQCMNESDVLRQIATTIGQMCPEEAPERLFTKILGLGQSASTHVKSFLGGWFIACLDGQVELTRFQAVWQAMVRSTPGRNQDGRQVMTILDIKPARCGEN